MDQAHVRHEKYLACDDPSVMVSGYYRLQASSIFLQELNSHVRVQEAQDEIVVE
jgi:hypothetical protein